MKTNFLFNKIINEEDSKLLDAVSYDDIFNKRKAIIELMNNGFSVLEISYYSETSFILIKRILKCKTPHDYYKLLVSTCDEDNAYYSLCIEDKESYSSYSFLNCKEELRKLNKKGKHRYAEKVFKSHNEKIDSFAHKLRRL